MKRVWVSLAVFLFFGGVYLVMKPIHARQKGDQPGFEDLVPCAFLTSIDSKRSLYLSGDHVARTSEKTDGVTNWASGTWDLIDDDRHLYKVTIEGNETVYALVTAPEGEGCMLAAGSVAAADLSKSWFSALTDPK